MYSILISTELIKQKTGSIEQCAYYDLFTVFLKGTNNMYNWEKTQEIVHNNWLSLRRYGKFLKFLNLPAMSNILCAVVFVLKEKEAREVSWQ